MAADPLVFMNYRGGDDPAAATLLYRELAARLGTGAVFLDYESIPLGHDFEPVLLQAVRRCSVLLVVIGRDWLTASRLDDPNDWVRREILEALAGSPEVVPVFVGGAEHLQEADLPTELGILARLQAFRIHPRQQLRDIHGLIDTLVNQVPRIADAAVNEARKSARTPQIVLENVKGAQIGDHNVQNNYF